MIRACSAAAALGIAGLTACADPVAPPVDSAEVLTTVTAQAPGGATKGYRYEGCGPVYGTCATVVMTAEQVGPVQWRFRGYIENRSFQARGADRNAMIVFAAVGENFADLHDGYRELDCGGCNPDGPSVIFASFTGPFDERCGKNRRCRDLMMEDFTDFGPSARPYLYPVELDFNYLSGRVYFDRLTFVDGWTPETRVHVTQFFVGGTTRTQDDVLGGIESYDLALAGTAPVRLPAALVATAAEQRSPEQAARHVARARATMRTAAAHRDLLQR